MPASVLITPYRKRNHGKKSIYISNIEYSGNSSMKRQNITKRDTSSFKDFNMVYNNKIVLSQLNKHTLNSSRLLRNNNFRTTNVGPIPTIFPKIREANTFKHFPSFMTTFSGAKTSFMDEILNIRNNTLRSNTFPEYVAGNNRNHSEFMNEKESKIAQSMVTTVDRNVLSTSRTKNSQDIQFTKESSDQSHSQDTAKRLQSKQFLQKPENLILQSAHTSPKHIHSHIEERNKLIGNFSHIPQTDNREESKSILSNFNTQSPKGPNLTFNGTVASSQKPLNVIVTNSNTTYFTKLPHTHNSYNTRQQIINTLTTMSPFTSFNQSSTTKSQKRIMESKLTSTFVSSNFTKKHTSLSLQYTSINKTMERTTLLPISSQLGESLSSLNGETQNITDREYLLENKNNATTPTNPNITLGRLMHLHGIHILFTNEKPNYTEIAKKPTLHLTASVTKSSKTSDNTTLDETNTFLNKNKQTTLFKTSSEDVRFSTMSENRYVGTAMVRNGHLFLVIYPPDGTQASPLQTDNHNNRKNNSIHLNIQNQTGYKSNKSDIGYLSSNNKSLHENFTQTPATLNGDMTPTTIEYSSYVKSLLVPAITKSIKSGLGTTFQKHPSELYYQSTTRKISESTKGPPVRQAASKMNHTRNTEGTNFSEHGTQTTLENKGPKLHEIIKGSGDTHELYSNNKIIKSQQAPITDKQTILKYNPDKRLNNTMTKKSTEHISEQLFHRGHKKEHIHQKTLSLENKPLGIERNINDHRDHVQNINNSHHTNGYLSTLDHKPAMATSINNKQINLHRRTDQMKNPTVSSTLDHKPAMATSINNKQINLHRRTDQMKNPTVSAKQNIQNSISAEEFKSTTKTVDVHLHDKLMQTEHKQISIEKLQTKKTFQGHTSVPIPQMAGKMNKPSQGLTSDHNLQTENNRHNVHNLHHKHHYIEKDILASSNRDSPHQLKRFNSPWQNIDLSSVLPSFPRKSHLKSKDQDDDSKSKFNLFSFVAKATDPFSTVQEILANISLAKNTANDTNGQSADSNGDSLFNFELTVQSDSNGENSKVTEEDGNSNGKNETADEIIELLSLSIQNAVKAYDFEFNKNEAVPKQSQSKAANPLSKSSSTAFTTTDASGEPINITKTLNLTTTKGYDINDKNTTSSHVMKHTDTATVKTVPYTIKHNYSTGTIPTTRSGMRGQFNHFEITEKETQHHFHTSHPTPLVNRPTLEQHHALTIPPHVSKFLVKPNKPEYDRTRFIRTQIVQDIVNPPTTNSVLLGSEQFQKSSVVSRKDIFHDRVQNQQDLNARNTKTPFKTSDMFTKRRDVRTEIQHEIPIDKALQLIKQQTNTLRSQDNPKQNNRQEAFNNEFNAMLILSIDDILSDQTNLHGALVVSFLRENKDANKT